MLGVSYKVNYRALLYCLYLKIIKKDEMAGGIKGLLEEKEYTAQNSTSQTYPNVIKEKVIKVVMNRLWKEANENPAIPWAERKTDLANPEYDQDAKMIARLCLCYYSGSMNFKNSRRHE